MTELIVTGLAAGYRDTPVLRELDLRVAAGELAAVLGPSGCGKTTLLRVLAGFHQASKGQVLLGGAAVVGDGMHVPPEQRRVGVVPQEGALFPHLSVGANVAFGLPRKRRGSGRVDEMLELVGLRGYAKRMPHELSGGQQQRVALARALAPEPQVVLLDEPFSALDAGLRAEVRADVRDALHATGATAVLVTHDQEEALGMADTVAVMRDGAIAQVGTAQQVYTEPADLAVALFVGEAVLFEVDAVDGVASSALGQLSLVTVDDAASGVGVAVARPEQLHLTAAPDDAAHAVVRDVVFHGHDATVMLAPLVATGALSDGGRLRARVQGHVPVRKGERVRIDVDGPVRFFPHATTERVAGTRSGAY
ncbi:MAG: ATP-binding cassette domain-containing protein [Actinophytocola sp.]|nr:ATP-binding cassette domain-containing protein [Actinophytocola sp.]